MMGKLKNRYIKDLKYKNVPHKKIGSFYFLLNSLIKRKEFVKKKKVEKLILTLWKEYK